jgi:hypothetical protein
MIRPQTQNKGPEHTHLKFVTHHHHLYRKLRVFVGSNLLFRQFYADLKMIRKEDLPYIYKQDLEKKDKTAVLANSTIKEVTSQWK